VPSRTKIAVPIVSAETPLKQQLQAARAAGANLIELRVDLIDDVPAIERLLSRPQSLPVILTVRSASEGGAWTGSDADRIGLIQRLGLLQPGYIDLEYETWQRSANLRRKIELVCTTRAEAADSADSRGKNRLILSHHDLRGTPPDLTSVFERLAGSPAEIIKAVFTAHDAADACRVLGQLGRYAPSRPTIALAMGEAGMPTRVLAAKFGAYLTFARLTPGGEAAPGQPTINELRERYRIDTMTPDTRLLGVVGWPVAHSLSPAIHNAAMAEANIDGVYLPLPVKPDFESFVAFMAELSSAAGGSVMGLSVTLPHKKNALDWLDHNRFPVLVPARRCGAVNTLTRLADGTWQGTNTDGEGVLSALLAAPALEADKLPGLTVDVLGAGGAARAVVATLSDQGCKVTILNRTPARAERLASELGCNWRPWEEREDYRGDVLINCTPVGLWPAIDETPMPDNALRRQTIVFDTVYVPAETRLLRAARSRGCSVVGGLAMLIGQAAAQFGHWHCRSTPIETMRAIGAKETRITGQTRIRG